MRQENASGARSDGYEADGRSGGYGQSGSRGGYGAEGRSGGYSQSGSRGGYEADGRAGGYGQSEQSGGYGADGHAGGPGMDSRSGGNSSRKPARDEGIRRSQRLLLTWLIENPELFDKINGIITAEDFVEDLYHQVAQLVFQSHAAGNLNPAAILNRFINDEDQYREVAALFNASLKETLNNEEQKKAFAETVIRVKKHSLDTASRKAKDISALQEIIKQQAALKQLHISLD